MEELSLPQRLAVWVLPVLFAITVHEVAHGWAARRLGDPTAMMLGRLTLNPLKHIDPVGSVLVPGLLLYFGGFLFGWARPVPITWENLKNPRRDVALVAAAGPAANLFMGLVWALVIVLARQLYPVLPEAAVPLVFMGVAGVFINAVVMVVNLLPLPPLDGGRVMTGLLPGRLAYRFARIEPYGMLLLVALLVLGILGRVLSPLVLAATLGLGDLGGLSDAATVQILDALGVF